MWAYLFSHPRRYRRVDGFTLVEVLVAIALFSSGLALVTQLVVLVSRSTVASRDMSYASALASQKLSQLATVAVVGLTPSPPDAWMRTAGNVEYLDSAGGVLSASASPPNSAVYIRRWSVTPLTGDVTGGVVLQVSAGRLRRQPLGGMPADARPSEVARVVGVRTGTVP
jgi:prepilin-type N-terminal cleavage/methylation domain-containing protein